MDKMYKFFSENVASEYTCYILRLKRLKSYLSFFFFLQIRKATEHLYTCDSVYLHINI